MLTVETGSCVDGADSFVSLAEAETHFAKYGGYWEGDPTDKEAALRRAALWMSSYLKWHGKRKCSGGILAWPRTGMTDCDGNAIGKSAIPEQVKLAQYAAAQYELQSPNGLNPSVTPGSQVLREKVDVIEVTYMTPQQQGLSVNSVDPINAQRVVLTQVSDLLKCFAAVPGRKVPWPVTV